MPELLSLSDWVVVFDLDDTLYQEDDYNQSGVIAVSRELARLYGLDITQQLLTVREENGDVWSKACELLDLPESVKESLLWIYRMHQPQIALQSNVSELMASVSDIAKQVVILTDGRSIMQRKKLDALGLLQYPIYISEEYSSPKPNIERFERIMSDFYSLNYVYIADNPVKDFVGPNSLDWRTIGLRDSGRNIHPQVIGGLNDEYLPDVWVNELDEIVDQLC